MLSGLLQLGKCQAGQVLGFARIKGQSGTPPASYTTSTAYVDPARNCSGGTVEVKSVGVGEYIIRFNGNSAMFAFAQVRFDSDNNDADNSVAILRIGAGPDAGAFRLFVSNHNSNFTEDADVTVMLI